MKKAHRASVLFSLCYESDHGRHCDRRFVDKVDFWRDIFPGNTGSRIAALSQGERCRQNFPPGILTPPFAEEKIIRFADTHFGNDQAGDLHPAVGRFYPQGYAWKALHCFPQNRQPFRILARSTDQLVGDTNHPLSTSALQLEARIIDTLRCVEEHGGSYTDIADTLTTDGPGMQVPSPGTLTDFYATYPFTRVDNSDDSTFYRSPRFVRHLDDTAVSQVESLYSRLLSPGWKILDLMSSWVSHLPDSLSGYEATGLGLNSEEMRANRQLHQHVVHDLNLTPQLPFADNQFDAVVCTASIEYLTRPLEVMQEVARVIRPGGISVTTFSDRWFPGKEVMIWADMHRFERLGLILDYYLRTESFNTLHTETVQGFPRPATDKHFGSSFTSDPIFAVWGSVNK